MSGPLPWLVLLVWLIDCMAGGSKKNMLVKTNSISNYVCGVWSSLQLRAKLWNKLVLSTAHGHVTYMPHYLETSVPMKSSYNCTCQCLCYHEWDTTDKTRNMKKKKLNIALIDRGNSGKAVTQLSLSKARNNLTYIIHNCCNYAKLQLHLSMLPNISWVIQRQKEECEMKNR